MQDILPISSHPPLKLLSPKKGSSWCHVWYYWLNTIFRKHDSGYIKHAPPNHDSGRKRGDTNHSKVVSCN